MDLPDCPPGTEGYDDSFTEMPKKPGLEEPTCTKAEQEFQEHLKSLKIKLEDGTNKCMVERRGRDISGKWIYLCYPCAAVCSGETILQTHLSGKKHKTKLTMNNVWPKSIFDEHPFIQNTKQAAPTEVTPKVLQKMAESADIHNNTTTDNYNKYRNETCRIQETIDKIEAPLLGVEYLIEHTPEEPHHEPEYICMLCDKKGWPRTIINHLNGFWHRYKYLVYHFTKASHRLIPFRNQAKYRDSIAIIIYRLAKRIVDKYGVMRPALIAKDEFERNKERIHQWMMKSPHFSENDGETFEEVVDIDLIESLAKSNPENELKDQRSAKKKDPSPPVVAAPSKFNNFTRVAGRQERRAPSVDSLSDISDEDQMPHRQGPKRNNKARNDPAQKPRYEPYPNRPRENAPFNTRYALRNDPGKSQEKTRAPNYAYKIKLAEDKRRLVEEAAQKTLAYHEKNPEKHPLYPEEWKKFWNRRYKEIQAEGKDPSKHDFKPEWIKFWTRRVKELHEEELCVQVNEIYRLLCLSPPVMTRHSPESRPQENKRRSPEPRRRSPNLYTRSPVPRKRSPPPRRRSPEPHRRSPEPHRKSPNLRRRSPEPWRRSPEPRRRTPELWKLPHLRNRSPELRNRSPDVRKRSPEPHKRSPELRKRSLEPHKRSLEPREKSPESRKRPLYPRSRSPLPRKRTPDSYNDRRRSPPRVNISLDSVRRSRSPLSQRDMQPRNRSPEARSVAPSMQTVLISDDELKPDDGMLSPWNSDDDIDSIGSLPEVRSHTGSAVSRGSRARRVERDYRDMRSTRDVRGPVPQELGPAENVVATLRLLVALEDYLGSLGPKIVDLLTEALRMEKEKANSSEELLERESALVLMETAKEKLKGAAQAGLVAPAATAAVRAAVVRAASTLHEADVRAKRNQKTKSNAAKPAAMPVAGVGEVDRAQIAQQMAEALIAQGKTDVSAEELAQLVDAVVGMAEAKKREADKEKNIDRPSVEKAKPQSNAKICGTASALQMLQSAYDENEKKIEKEDAPDAMDGLSDADLETLLKNFNDLSVEEQHSLIAYLKKLESREPQRVERLRQYVSSAASTAPQPEPNVSEKVRDVVTLESDEDDYTVEEVLQSATEKVREDKIRQEMEIVKKSLEESKPEPAVESPAVVRPMLNIISNFSSASDLFALVQASLKSTSAGTLAPTTPSQDVVVSNTQPRSFGDLPVVPITNLGQLKLMLPNSSTTLKPQVDTTMATIKTVAPLVPHTGMLQNQHHQDISRPQQNQVNFESRNMLNELYKPNQYDQDQYNRNEYTQDQYNQDQHNRDQYNQDQHNRDQYNQDQHNRDQYKQVQHNRDQFKQDQHNQNQYKEEQQNQDQYNQNQYNQDQHNQDQYNQNQYNQDQPNQGQYNQNQYNQGQPNQDQYNQNQYNQDQHNQDQYNQNQYNQDNQDQYNQNQYNQDQPNQDQYNKTQYNQDQHHQGQYNRGTNYNQRAWNQRPNNMVQRGGPGMRGGPSSINYSANSSYHEVPRGNFVRGRGQNNYNNTRPSNNMNQPFGNYENTQNNTSFRGRGRGQHGGRPRGRGRGYY